MNTNKIRNQRNDCKCFALGSNDFCEKSTQMKLEREDCWVSVFVEKIKSCQYLNSLTHIIPL